MDTRRVSINTGRLTNPKVASAPAARHPYKKGTELTFPDGTKYVVSDRGPWIRTTARRHEGKMNGIHNNSVRRRSNKKMGR
jgi:hypothetical protein